MTVDTTIAAVERALTVTPSAADDHAALAAKALDLAGVRPELADGYAAQAERSALANRDWRTVSVARRASGVAAMQLDHLDLALTHLRGAIAAARKAADPQLRAEAHMSLASALVLRGAPTRAIASIQAALGDLTGVKAARARTQRAAILQELGRIDEALDDLRRALPVLRRFDDIQWEARALSNRSLLLITRRHFAAAEADLLRARRLCAENGFTLPEAYVEQNLGCVCAGRGDVPAALEHFDAAAARYHAFGLKEGSLLIDRANVLLSVRLVTEARETAAAAVATFAAQHRGTHLPEAQLLLSTTALLDDDLDTAKSSAADAARGFARLGRKEWLALARYAQLQADVAATRHGNPNRPGLAVADGPPVAARRARACAAQLEQAGWTVPALEARVLAGRLALNQGRPQAARADLALAARARRSGPADARVRAWLAEALLREAEGRRRGAMSALRTGLKVVQDYRATLGATELRAHVSVHRGGLARAGLRMALSDGDARAAHFWAEHGRASANLMRPVRPPDDPSLAHDLQDLRTTMAEIESARGDGSPASTHVARQVELERRIRDHSRRAQGWAGPAARPPSIRELAEALGEAALVEFLELDGVLHAVTVVDGRTRLHLLGPSDPVRHSLTHLPFALHRLAHPSTAAAQLNAASTVLDHAAASLDATLFAPLTRWLGDRPLLIVPAAWLQSLPWSILPSCVGRPVSVAPSAALWHSAARRPPPRNGGVVVVAGPGLPGALAEAHAVAALHSSARILHGSRATAAAVAAAMNGALITHVAAHGTVRSDNPLFSSLLLADGPFTVYDLERLASTPHHVILAACDTARSHVTAGEEILGLAAALLTQQTTTLIAPVVPIPDAETAPLMTTYHRRLLAGDPPATALAHAQQQHNHDGTRARASAASFVCLGAGNVTAVSFAPHC